VKLNSVLSLLLIPCGLVALSACVSPQVNREASGSPRGPTADSGLFTLTDGTLEKMIPNEMIGSCRVQIEQLAQAKVRLSITKPGAVYTNGQTHNYTHGEEFKKSFEVDLSRTQGTETYPSDDYTGMVRLNDTGGTVLYFDTRTRLVYRAVGFNAAGFPVSCESYQRPKL